VLGLEDAAAGGDDVFRHLVLGRIIEPVSKLDSRPPDPTTRPGKMQSRGEAKGPGMARSVSGGAPPPSRALRVSFGNGLRPLLTAEPTALNFRDVCSLSGDSTARSLWCM